jgi:hypothetical protein
MRKLTLFMVAGLLIVAAATVSYAGYNDSITSIDTNGVASLSISTPSAPISVASGEKVNLDSIGVFAVNDLRHSGTAAAAVQEKKGTENMYCFDSGSRFCARSY